MKNVIIYILAIIIMTPPQAVHNDVIVYDDVETHLEMENTHEHFHHKNDTEHDKKTKHHHHCTVTLFVLTFCLPTKIAHEIKSTISKNTQITYYKSSHTNSFTGNIFHPPRV